MSRHRSSSKKAPPDIGLHMECVEEELEPSQIAYYTKAEKEFNEVQNKLDNYVKKMRAEVVEKGENCIVLQLNATPSTPPQVPASPAIGKPARQSVQANQNYQPVVGQGILTRSAAGAAGNTYLVMDPHLGFMVGQMQPQNTTTDQTVTTSKPSSGRGRQSTSSAVMVTTRAKSSLKKQTGNEEVIPPPVTPPMTRTRDKTKNQLSPQISPQIIQQQAFSPGSTPSSGNYKIKVNAKPLPAPSNPGESSALGGLSAGNKAPWKPNDEPNKNTPDSREVVFNKAAGKTFPSLVVVARPHLKVKYIPQSIIAHERTALDAKVKLALMNSSTKFIEWLIQQGLIKSEQTCQVHLNYDMSFVKLKLGKYSNVTKFPYSGGYVWVSDCCPSQLVSVFSGSIFEGAPHPPTTLLKLIYHWACQTNVQNVVQWVKVDNLYLKNFYMNMRAVCTQAVQEKYKKMGGPKKKIEVGVISLGTTSQDGCRRQVKVEVLGVMDHESKLVRLRAVDPLSDERSFKRRFVKILEPLEEWVHKDSTILTDFTVAKAALNSMGFHTVYQVTNESKYSNQNVMEYLRKIVPRMFQNTLSLLSRQIIQQFLDELVWREMWGPIPSQAFVNIVNHIAEQTKMDVSESLLTRLSKVAANPLKRWDYSVWKNVTTTRSSSKTLLKAPETPEPVPEVTPEPETPTISKGIRTRKRAAEQQSANKAAEAPPETPPSPVVPRKIPKVYIKDKLKKEEKTPRKEEKPTKKEEKIPKKEEKPLRKEKEPSDKLSEDVTKFINDGQEVPLTTYYYGSLNGNERRDHVSKGHFNVKCGICNKRFSNNIVLMKHMILHCQTEPSLAIDLKRVHQCEYCLLGFNATSALNSHLEMVHYVVDGKLNTNLLCHICEEKFKNRTDLIFHMHRTHVQLEMPYECGICHFRTSLYRVFVSHFFKVHNREEFVFCPYCLKVVMLSFKGEVIVSNVIFFMSHLEKHQRLSLVKDCFRCQLSFIHKGILDQHLDADHGSWKDEPGIQPVAGLPEGILMPEPGLLIKPISSIKIQKSPKMKNTFGTSKFKTLELYGIDEDMACIECEGSLMRSEHFTGCFNCTKCRFASCCERAMLEHLVIFHETSHPQFTKGKPVILQQEMYCVCGYSSTSGNRLAKHLALCERKSAYSSEESAMAAVHFTAKEDSVKHGEGQNMLNMLGLVRKSPESTATATENESMKMEVDVEGAPAEAEPERQCVQDSAVCSSSKAGDSPTEQKVTEKSKASESSAVGIKDPKKRSSDTSRKSSSKTEANTAGRKKNSTKNSETPAKVKSQETSKDAVKIDPEKGEEEKTGEKKDVKESVEAEGCSGSEEPVNPPEKKTEEASESEKVADKPSLEEERGETAEDGDTAP